MKHWTLLLFSFFLSTASIGQYQLIQTTIDSSKVIVVTSNNDTLPGSFNDHKMALDSFDAYRISYVTKLRRDNFLKRDLTQRDTLSSLLVTGQFEGEKQTGNWTFYESYFIPIIPTEVISAPKYFVNYQEHYIEVKNFGYSSFVFSDSTTVEGELRNRNRFDSHYFAEYKCDLKGCVITNNDESPARIAQFEYLEEQLRFIELDLGIKTWANTGYKK